MKKNPTIPELVWQFFCSIKLTIYTLLLLATTSIIGTVILQNGSAQQYLQLYGQGGYNLIQIFNLNDMYHAWWFLLLLLVLCINIVVCSIDRLSVTWKIIFPKTVGFNPDRFRKLKNRRTIQSATDSATLVQNCDRILSRQTGPVIKESTDTGMLLYAEKGRWTKIGVYVVHASILLLLVGAMIGSLFGFKAMVNIDEGSAVDTVFEAKTRVPIKLDFAIQCNDFDVSFYDTGTPKEFRSSLTIIENGKESLTTDILVNHPLRYKGINIFQSSYGASRSSRPDTVVLEIIDRATNDTTTQSLKIGESFELPDGKGTFVLESFQPDYDFRGNSLGQAFIGSFTDSKGQQADIGMPLRFPSFDKMRKGDFAFVVKEFEQKYYTGLQVTRDPGIWYVYAGFALMIIGCWITFFMAHQCVFIEIIPTGNKTCSLSISGTTNRNSQGLKLKLNTILNKIEGK